MHEPRFARAAQCVLIAALFLALAAYAWRGSYTRYLTDDYCTAGALRTMGFPSAMRYHRDLWSGRFSYFAIKSGLESIGPVTARVVPGALVLLLAGAIAWGARRALIGPNALPGIATALAVAFAGVDAAPEALAPFGPFIWETGAVTYMLPGVLYAFWMAVVLARGAVVVSCIAGAALMFAAGGLSETSLSAQGAMTAGTLVLALFYRNRRIFWIAGAGLAATFGAFAIAASAPGNAIRAAGLPPQPPLIESAATTLKMANAFIGSHLYVDGAALLVVIVAGLCAPRIPRALAWQVAGLATACYVASFVPSAWLLSSAPPARALAVPLFFFIVALFALSNLVRVKPKVIPVLMLVVAIVPVRAAWKVARTIPEGRTTAAQVDVIETDLRRQRGQDAVLHSRWALEYRYLDEDPNDWANRCVSRYFDLRSLRVERR